MRICRTCKNSLNIENFYKSKNYKDGIDKQCKICSRKYSKSWKDKNRDKYNLQAKNYRQSNKEKGLCSGCSNPTLLHNKLCEKHWFANVASVQLKNPKLGPKLKEIAIKQNYKCIYSDELLIPAQNMSLDHIQSRKDRPDLSLDINNVQWVTKKMNFIKYDLSHDNFIKLCKCIAERF